MGILRNLFLVLRSFPDRSSQVKLSDRTAQQSQLFLHVIGYGFLALWLSECLWQLIPLQLTNPIWELDTIRGMVDQSPILLLGLGLSFFRQPGLIRRLELHFLNLLSWGCLGLGMTHLFLIGLLLSDGARVHQIQQGEIALSMSDRQEEIRTFRRQLEEANTPGELERLLAEQGKSEVVVDPKTTRENLLKELEETQAQLKQQIQVAQQKQGRSLVKELIKLILGTGVVGMVLLQGWRTTACFRAKLSHKSSTSSVSSRPDSPETQSPL